MTTEEYCQKMIGKSVKRIIRQDERDVYFVAADDVIYSVPVPGDE